MDIIADGNAGNGLSYKADEITFELKTNVRYKAQKRPMGFRSRTKKRKDR